jgi:hypothetical protein
MVVEALYSYNLMDMIDSRMNNHVMDNLLMKDTII